ncbi:hypothetical protein L3Q82_008162 [Scortum barcoo]|uniref:Uncharacterized protein n=1 Tax=Scortum barcoo TaxID=214431 RepID=A0ACB8WH84_9TELE|nr:hypothetical protein L3Q82_008162 [Scortum barcoo]
MICSDLWDIGQQAGAGRRLRGPEPGTEDNSISDEPPQFAEGERPRPQGSSPVEEYPETEKYSDSDKECEVEHDRHRKSGSGKKTKKSGLGSMFEKRSTPKMSKLKEVHSPESGVIVKTAKDGCAEGLIYGGGGKEGIFIKEVIPESPASKNLKLKEGDQVLSATVYFDNVSYEDAIQILEHAQAYKVKLCLKRKPDITEAEPTLESEVIPEDDVYPPEMREQGKTKRRGDARISWPKFPSFGKGRKSGFRRSHSSSEADEQRKLELSPTTSDTESPIKSQDALKGKKKHKIKLPTLSKRGRISSSEEQDTDAPTSGQISGNILQTHESDMLSPEGLESPSGETPEVYVTQKLKEVEELRHEQNDQKLTEPQTVQHKVELITIGSTLKTEDLTVALAGQESPSGKSPDGKKKKKEKSELKMKILGKDKSHKKDAKAKSSPKRLKTLGASFEIADQPEVQKSDVIPSSELQQQAKSETMQIEMSAPKVELDISDVAFVQKSPRKGEEKTKKGKDKQKHEAKTSPTFKLPKVGFSDITTEETIQKINVNVEESTAKIEQLTAESTEVKEDPYERLSKGSISGTKLPKREDIEIPGMEDMSKKTKAKGIKEPKAVFSGHHEEIQAETVQLSIDVDSVKEAVSKLPGFKLPKVDDSGVPIPEEITVIDANAQRISVKTPTKVVDTKAKHEAHFTKFDITASPDISKTTIKLPKIATPDLTSDELLTETKVDLKKTEKKQKSKAKQSGKDIKTEVYEREHIIIPGKESTQEEIILQTQVTEESDKKSKKAKITAPSFGIAKPDIKIPNIGIDFPKQNIAEEKINVEGERTIVKTSKTETRKGKGQTEGIVSDVKIPEIDGIEYIDSVDGLSAKKDGGIRFTGVGVNLEATKPSADISLPEIRGEVKHVEVEHTIKTPKFGVVTPDISVQVPDSEKDINIDGAEIKREGLGSKFKIPNLGISMPKVKGPKIDLSSSKKNIDVTLPEGKAEGKLPEVPEVDITLRNVDVSIPMQKMEVEKAELDIKPLQTEGEPDGQGGRFKMPKFGIKMPKIKGPEIDLSSSKKEAEANIQIPDDANISVDIKQQESEAKMEVQESKFRMPKLGIAMSKTKGPEIDSSLNKKDKDLNLPEAKAEVKVTDVELTKPSAEMEITAPEIKVPKKDAKEVPDKEAKIDGADIKIPEEVLTVEIAAPSIDTEGKSIDTETTGTEHEGKGGKFKMPKFGVTLPKVTGPEIDLSLSKKDLDVTLPEAKAEVSVPDTELKKPSTEVEITAPEIKVTTKDKEGSPSKFKMPTFKLPKFGVGMPSATVEMADKEAKIDGADIKIPEEVLTVEIAAPSIDTEGKTDIDIKTIETEHEGKGGKFKIPKFGISLPKVKGPEIDLSISKKDVDVTLPEAKAEVKLPEVQKVDVSLGKEVSLPEEKLEVKKPQLELKSENELDGQGGKLKMPKLGMSMPKLKGPEIHFGLSKKDGDVTLPEAKAEVKVPEAPEVDVSLGKTDVSLSEEKLEVKNPELKMESEIELDGQGGKFKMPKLGMSMPKLKGPEIHFGLSKKDGDVTLPEAKAEIEVPKVELKEPSVKMEMKAPEITVPAKGTEGSPTKFKMPSFKLPKFGFGTPTVSAEVPDLDKDVKIDGGDINIPEEGSAIKISAPSIDIEPPSIDIKTTATEQDGKESKFKISGLGFSMPKVKGPKIDLSLSKKDVDVTVPEAKADVKLPEANLREVDVSIPEVKMELPEAKATVKLPEAPQIAVEMQQPECDVEMGGHDAKFKMPKFGIKMPNIKGPEFDLSLSKKDADVKVPEVDLEKVDVSIPEAKMEVKKPELEMQTEGEFDGKTAHFKMPKFGIKMPKIQGPDIDLSLSKKDVDVKLPNAPQIDVKLDKTEVSIPGVKVDGKEPELEIKSLQTELEGQGTTFKMPKFEMAMPKVKGPTFHTGFSKKDVDVTLPEAKADVSLPDVQLNKPPATLEIKAPEIEVVAKDTEGSPFFMPKVEGPALSFPKKDTDITLQRIQAEAKLPRGPKLDASLGKAEVLIPEAKVEVKKPEVKIKSLKTSVELEKQESKFKMPKFGISLPKVKGPEIDLSFSKKDADVTLPETKAEVKLPEAPKMDVKLGKVDVSILEAKMEVEKPQLEIKSLQSEGELDGQGSKYKMPKFGISMPKVKGPEIDFGLSKKDGDVTLPEAKAEVSLPDVEPKEPSAEVETEAPAAEGQLSSMKGSPSKFKMPTFNFPKFGVASPNVIAEVPDMDKEIKSGGGDMNISVPHTDVDIPKVKAEVHVPEIKVKEPSGVEVDAKLKKPRFSLPRFSFSKPTAKVPEADVSLPDVNVAIPEGKVEVKVGEAKAEVKLPDVELEKSSTEMEIKAPEIKVAKKDKERSPLKLNMPTVKLPKFGVGMPSATAEVPDKEAKLDGADIKIPEEVLTVEITAPSIDMEVPSIDMKTTEAKHEGKGGKFEMPKFGMTMPKVKGPEIDLNFSKKNAKAEGEIKLPDVEVKEPSAKVEIKPPEIATQSIDIHGPSLDVKMTGTEEKGGESKFKVPKFGISLPKVQKPETDVSLLEKGDVKLPETEAEVKLPEAPKVDVSLGKADVSLPEKKMEVEKPDLEMQSEVEVDGQGSKFKMPKLGMSISKVKGPEIHFGLSKKDGDVTLPEAKAEVKVADTELKKPSAEVEITAPDIKVAKKDKEESPSKFKMPTFKLPKFGVGMPSATVEMPDKEAKIDGADIKIPEEVLTVEIAAPSISTEGKSVDIKTTGTEHEGKGGKFKMPKFGIAMPKLTGPEIDLSLSKKDVDVTLPEAKAEVKVTDVELKKTSAEVEITAPEIKVATKDTKEAPSRFKMPTFKLPKFGVGMPSATVEMADKEAKIDGADIKKPEEVLSVEIAAPSIDTEGKSIDIKTTGTEHEGKGGKFKMPKFGVTIPKVTGPGIDLSLSKKDVDITLPEAKAEIKLPDAPKVDVTGPEIDLSLSKKDVDVTLPEAKAEVKVTDAELKKPSAEVEITAPDIKVAKKDKEGSPSKFKMPTFKLPKFGVGMPSATVEVADKESTIDGAGIKKPEEVLTVEIAAPSIDTEGKSIDIKTTGTEHEGKGGKFKMPKFGVTLSKVTGPEIDLSLSKKDVEITLPEAKAEIKPPDAPKVDISLGKAEVSLPEEKLEVKKPELEMESETELDGQGGKFKMPKLGMSMPKVTGPEIHFGLLKKDGDVTLPEAKAEIKVADTELKKPSAEVEITAPDIKHPALTLEGKSIDIKTTGTEHEGKGGKFKMPKFGVSVPKVTGPEIDLSLSKKDVDVTLPEAKAEVKVTDAELKKPSAEVEITAPDIKVAKKDKEGSPSKFKMPTFKLPKFGVGMPSATVEMADKEAKIDGADIKKPEEVLSVEIAAPSIDTEGKSIDIKTTGTEHEGKGGKFKMPKFGITVPKVTGPEIDLSISKKDVDVTFPGAKAEVKVPEAELKKPSAEVEITAPGIDIQTGTAEGSPSKFKMPTFTLPKFGGATPQVSVEASDVDKQIKLAGADLPEAKAEVTLPDVKMKAPVTSVSVPQAEGDAKVKKTRFSLPRFSFSKQSTTEHEVDASLPDTDVSLPEGKMEVKQPEVELPEGGVELDKQESKFKMPKFGISMPKVKGPEIDLNLSKKDVGVTLPEAKAEVQLPDVEIKQSSAKVKIKAPQIEAQAGKVEGSPSNLKMPSLTLPKFGADSSKISVEVPDVDKDIKIDGANLSVPKKGATVDVTATSTDTEGLSVDVKAKESETQASGSKFKMPNFGISMPKVKGPEMDLSISKKDVDVTLPEVKAETKLPEVKEPEAAISVLDAPQAEVEAKSKKPNWTFPKFSFSRTGGKAPDDDVNLEASKVGVTSPEAEAKTGLPNVEVQGPSGAISVEEPPAVKARFSLPRFSFSKSSGKEPEDSAEPPHVDVSLPEGEVIVKQPEMEMKAPEPETGQDGQGSKFKLPKFGITLPKTKGPEEDLNASKKDIDITLPEVKAEVKLPEIEVKKSSASVEMKASDIEAKSKDVGGSPSKFKMPTVKMLKFGVTTSDVTIEAPDVAKVDETDGAKLKDDDTVGIKGVSVDIKTDVSKAAITDPEMPKTETDSVGLGSPSKFKLFKMPKLSFSKSKPEDETAPAKTESKEDQMETEDELKGESKSPKMTLTSFGEILKNIDVEFDIPKTENEEEPGGNQLEGKEKETITKQDAIKSPERTGWFKFPKFGLSSPSEPAKTPEKDKDEKSPTVDEEISPTSSVRSSDAFADVSSAMTSEHAGLSLSSPTKVTVKYSDPDVATGHGEMHSNIITSTTRTELISVEPNLPEKITILSSGVSSSSEDTLRLDSGKIHVITSNIQATPESQHAKLLAAIQVQPAGGLPPQSETTEATSWTVEESKSGKRTVFERHLVRETSSEKSESKETIVITKQITRMLDSSEPISGETASSIQRLKDSVHSEKMKFFDGAEK